MLDVRSIARFTPAAGSSTSVTLTNGTELVALKPYAAFREAVKTALGSVGPLAH